MNMHTHSGTNDISLEASFQSDIAIAEQYFPSQISPMISSYTDHHFGFADGIIDPSEYGFNYTDPDTSTTIFFEHNDTHIFVGLESATTGWIGLAWKESTENFTLGGLNQSDIIRGYAPGTTHTSIMRALPTDVVEVEYILQLRNGTVWDEGTLPVLESDTPLENWYLFQRYKEEIISMRINETNHFIVDAADAYTSPGHTLYGEDLEYTITLRAIKRDGVIYNQTPTLLSRVVFEDDFGNGTLGIEQDLDMTRVLAANASDDGTTTQVEFILSRLSVDDNDVMLVNDPENGYPFIILKSNSEDFESAPTNYTVMENAFRIDFPFNTVPEVTVISPESDNWDGVITLNVSVTDDTFVRSVSYSFDNLLPPEEWDSLRYNYTTDTWSTAINTNSLLLASHSFYIDAWDASEVNKRIHWVINVVDNTPPIIDSPGDLSFYVHDTEKTILWSASDGRPTSYRILRNGSMYEYGDWDGSNITVDLDEFGTGAYNFTLFVFDEGDNISSDIVIVTITEYVTPTTHHNDSDPNGFLPLDLPLFSLLLTVGSVCIIIIFSVLIIKARKQTALDYK